MPINRYISLTVDGDAVDLYPVTEFPLSISYKLEDSDDFQTKSSSTALSLKFPASPNNDKIFNIFHDPSVMDQTPMQTYRNFRRCAMIANSWEIGVGKALLTNAIHNSRPKEYQVDFYGNNGDWIIDLQDNTLYDFLKDISFPFTDGVIQTSWVDFDGTSEGDDVPFPGPPYVFAPVRYGQAMNGIYLPNPDNLNPRPVQYDWSMPPEYMKPSIQPWYIIRKAFASLGYRIQSDFMNTSFFRRQVMPWTWGAYLNTDGTRLDVLKFLAKSNADNDYWIDNDYEDTLDLRVTNKSTSGAYDNSGTYAYDPARKAMTWTYPIGTQFEFGTLLTTFHIGLNVNCTIRGSAAADAAVHWYKQTPTDPAPVEDVSQSNLVFGIEVDPVGRKDFIGIVDSYASFIVNPGDVISCTVDLYLKKDLPYGTGNATIFVDSFDYQYSRIPPGGRINFNNYTAFKNYPFLNFLKGIIDSFNLSIQTDPINKVVLIEPQHPYSLINDLSVKRSGYFNGNTLNYNNKQDLSVDSDLSLFSDYERQLVFKLKDDQNDGILKLIQDRNTTVLAQGAYVLPERFKTDIKTIENNFFAPVMHYRVEQWRAITGFAPQIVCMVPENISNTSASEAQNTFTPKLCYYKGVVSGAGGWVYNETEQTTLPFMFAVNYNPNGENDPILSYSDELIGFLNQPGGPVVGKGLLKRFFWQRLAIMRNGQYYSTFFNLNNNDICNWFHREYIIARDQRWQLMEINNYSPTVEKSTACMLQKWEPVSAVDMNNTYPSPTNIKNGVITNSTYETKYAQLLALTSDIGLTPAPIDPSTGFLPSPPSEDCVPAAIGPQSLPEGTVGTPYLGTVVIAGTPPFIVTPITAPSWMLIDIPDPSGFIVYLSGTPDASGDVEVSFVVTNCDSDADSTSIDTHITINP